MNGDVTVKKKFQAIGCGFAGLDIVKYGTEELFLPGGTCANVMSVLASLNWQTTIIKPEYPDFWGDYVDSVWKSFGVIVDNCFKVETPTPRVIQEFTEHEHFFYTRCPKCGTLLLKLALPTIRSIEKKFSEFNYDILYYDRISMGIRHLIKLCNSSDKWTFYEPNNARSYKTFVSNVAECDIVKFSDKRVSPSTSEKLLTDLKNINAKTKIVMVTHESSGVSYSILKNDEYSEYKTTNVRPFKNVVDSSGAGDWLSAGFIDSFVRRYPKVTYKIDENEVLSALNEGHTQAEKCCSSVGAVGGLINKSTQKTSAIDSACEYCRI